MQLDHQLWRMNRVLAFLAMLIIVAACALPRPAVAETIRLSGPPIWDSAVLLDLVERQPLKNQDLTFSFVPWKNPNQLRAMLLDGSVDLAIVPSISVALFANNGIELVPFFAHRMRGNLALIGRGGALSSLSDLPARSIAVPFKGDLPDIVLRRLGLTHAQALYVSNPVAAMQMLLSGRVANAFLPEPFVTVVQSKEPAVSVRLGVCEKWERTMGVSGCPLVGVVASPQGTLSKKSSNLISAAYKKAFKEVAAKPDRAAMLLASAFANLPAPILNRSFQNISGHILAGQDAADQLQNFLQVVHKLEPAAIGGKVPDLEFYEPSGVSD